MHDEQADDERWCEYHVTPRYLAGSGYCGDPGFLPIDHWPSHDLGDGPCQLLVTSPDHRIRVAWFGDDFDLWKISAAPDPVAPPAWTATFNQATPPEIVQGLTAALAHDWDAGDERFLARPQVHWADSIRPLTDAGWKRTPAHPESVELIAPDQQAGARIDRRGFKRDDEPVVLWAGPPGPGSRMEARFSSDTPTHLIAATAAAMADPAPVVRERHMLHPSVRHLVRLTPTGAPQPGPSHAPTPLDIRRIAVAAAVQRASRDPHADARVQAARVRTSTAPTHTAPPAAPQPPDALPSTAHTPARHR